MSTEALAEAMTLGVVGFFIAICIAGIVAQPSGLPTAKKWLALCGGALVIAVIGVASNYILGAPFFGGLILGYVVRIASKPLSR